VRRVLRWLCGYRPGDRVWYAPEPGVRFAGVVQWLYPRSHQLAGWACIEVCEAYARWLDGARSETTTLSVPPHRLTPRRVDLGEGEP
jgi:hypothetical protein